MQWRKKINEAAEAVTDSVVETGTAVVAAARRTIPQDLARARASLEAEGRRISAGMSREEVVGRALVGALAFGAVAVGAVAVGAFAIGRLSVGKAAIGEAEIGRLKIGQLEIDEILAPAIAAYPSWRRS